MADFNPNLQLVLDNSDDGNKTVGYIVDRKTGKKVLLFIDDWRYRVDKDLLRLKEYLEQSNNTINIPYVQLD